MSNQTWNSQLPVTKHGKQGVQVPLDQALKDPKSVWNTTPKNYLPKQPNEIGPKK